MWSTVHVLHAKMSRFANLKVCKVKQHFDKGLGEKLRRQIEKDDCHHIKLYVSSQDNAGSQRGSRLQGCSLGPH